MAKLIDNTVLAHPETGAPTVLLAGEDVPSWASKLVGKHLLAEEPKPARRTSDPDGSLPPKSGNGSGAANWLAYARNEENAAKLEAAEIAIPDDASRDDIIAALEKAEIPTEKQSA